MQNFSILPHSSSLVNFSPSLTIWTTNEQIHYPYRYIFFPPFNHDKCSSFPFANCFCAPSVSRAGVEGIGKGRREGCSVGLWVRREWWVCQGRMLAQPHARVLRTGRATAPCDQGCNPSINCQPIVGKRGGTRGTGDSCFFFLLQISSTRNRRV